MLQPESFLMLVLHTLYRKAKCMEINQEVKNQEITGSSETVLHVRESVLAREKDMARSCM